MEAINYGKSNVLRKCGSMGQIFISKKCKFCGTKKTLLSEEMMEKYNIFTHDWCSLFDKIGYSIPVENSRMIEELISRENDFIMSEVAGNPFFSMEAYEKQLQEERASLYRVSQCRINEMLEQMDKNLAAMQKEKDRKDWIPECPICGSSNIQKITLGTRAVKTAAFGVVGAVDDAGKTYKCSNCGSKF